MEKNFVLNGNKLIMIFIGENGPTDSDGTPIFESINGRIRWTKEVKKNSLLQINRSRYHESWDWLMPVFIKCKDLLHTNINDNKQEILNCFKTSQKHKLLELNEFLVIDIFNTTTFTLDKFYNFCIKVIKYNNKMKKENMVKT